MSVLSTEQRLRVLGALVDGNSERAVERLCDVDRLTIRRFALRLGKAAQSLHNVIARDLSCSVIETDEIWSYVGKKDARATPEERAAGLGEAYTFVGLAMPARFVVTWKVGRRDQATTDAYMADLRSRLVVMPAMTSDGFSPYVSAVGANFGPSISYAQTVKNYTKKGRRDDDHRYEPPREPFITKKAVYGAPDLDRASTSHVERNNGTMRHHIGRMRRLCYAFSKSPEHHAAAVALCYTHYNLCWIPRTTRVTPALAVGAVDHVYELPELLDALLSVPETPAPLAKPLAHPMPETTARALPNGRGFLRVVGGGGAPSPSPAPEPAPVAPAAASAVPVSQRWEQMDLLSWRRPLPPPGTQLGLFGDD